ncbi:MAG: carbohydrate ABC transporter permease [Anaerolineales bacterium]|jgi:putative chitobiose transport system permease protein
MANTSNQTLESAARRRRKAIETIVWYVILLSVAVITVFPFVWILFTSFKGPFDPIYSVPPQLIPRDFTINNYTRVWDLLPVGRFYLNSVVATFAIVIFNVLFTSLAAYPLAKMKFPGRNLIFYMLLATYIVPPVLTSIPSFVLAVKVFHFYDKLSSVILPYLAGILSIFLMRQAFMAVPDDLIDAGRIDGASELHIWWSIVMPIVRPSLATVAIITFVEQWNNFFWPSLMLHTRENMTLQVGLVALQGAFSNDARGVAAGVVMTIIPIIIFFFALQQQFVRGLTGAVKG